MDEALRGLDFCYGYIDDILIFSESTTQHQQHLRQLFQRLADYGILINTAKCVLGMEQVNFLGYSVSADGIKPLPAKVEAVQQFPQPKTVKELRRFLGMVNFYRRFVPNAAILQAPLNELLSGPKVKGSQPINMTPEHAKVLPLVLLGLRSAWKEDLQTSAAELVYGEPLRLPGQFFQSTSNEPVDVTDFASRLKQQMVKLAPAPTSQHGSRTFYVPKGLQHCTTNIHYLFLWEQPKILNRFGVFPNEKLVVHQQLKQTRNSKISDSSVYIRLLI
ncbi:hypothetical protein ABMA28_008088 [Loxostege sticticalis]|uniref:Reverse transcriptase domain-containing protein n=1 Tax=Loxostege sticticalis TaxID=481309 RepID=A0ABD0SJT3_LOXSC